MEKKTKNPTMLDLSLLRTGFYCIRVRARVAGNTGEREMHGRDCMYERFTRVRRNQLVR